MIEALITNFPVEQITYDVAASEQLAFLERRAEYLASAPSAIH